jgi:hypothetical protein
MELKIKKIHKRVKKKKIKVDNITHDKLRLNDKIEKN